MSDRARNTGIPFWGDMSDAEALQRYQTLVDAIDDGIYQLDSEGHFVGVNERIVEATEYRREDLLGEHVSLVLDEDDIQQIKCAFQQRFQTGDIDDSIMYETTIESAAGKILTCELQINLLISSGEFHGSIGRVSNITEHKERRQEAKLFRTLLDYSNDGVLVINPNTGQFIDVNETACNRLGYDRDELLKMQVPDIEQRFADIEDWRSHVEDVETEDAVTIEGVHERKDGTTYPAEVNVVHVELDREYMIAIARDITERRKHERRLEESERRYRTLAENFPNGVVALFDSDFRYTAAGGQLISDPGIDRKEAIGRSIYDRYPEELVEEIEPHFETTLDGEERSFEVSYYGRDFLAQTLPIGSTSGEQKGMLVAQDITERKEYRRKLEESNERLEQFAYAASHDLQEPLRMVTSYLDLLESRYADDIDEDGEEFIAYAVDGAERMKEMIDGLLEYSRVETQGESFEPVDLEGVLADVKKNLELQIDESNAVIELSKLPCVKGDQRQLGQLFQNLLCNAIEYSGDEPRCIHISAEKEGVEWIVSVRDNGIGIQPDQQDRIFDVFQRLHSHEEYTGTGIGLALCKRIVERHGGEIWVDSEPSEGSTFSFTLPATDA